MVGTPGRCRIDLNSPYFHCITDHDCFIDIFHKYTTLKETQNEVKTPQKPRVLEYSTSKYAHLQLLGRTHNFLVYVLNL